jgi:hypothetical protein
VCHTQFTKKKIKTEIEMKARKMDYKLKTFVT